MSIGNIFRCPCIECGKSVDAVLTEGAVVFKDKPAARYYKFWVCPHCKNSVARRKDDGKPVGAIPNPQVRRLRQNIHMSLDAVWATGRFKRRDTYDYIARLLNSPTFQVGHICNKTQHMLAKNAIKVFKEQHNIKEPK